MVFAYHVHLAVGAPRMLGLGPVLHRLYLGVDGFFILSGLVLALAHPRLPLAPGALAAFWLRRLQRIYPVHLAMILLLFLLLGIAAAAGIAPRDPARFAPAELLRSLLLVHGWGLSDGWAWNYPSWSISTEWAGYLAFPLLWLAVRRLPGGAVVWLPPLMLALLAWVEWRAGGAGLNLSYSGALGRFFPEFAAGMALARLGVPRLAGGVLALAGLAVCILALFALPDAAVVAGLWLLLAGLFWQSRQGGPAGGAAGWLGAAVPLWLGSVSYAFYMSFAPVELVQSVLWRHAGAAPSAHPLVYAALASALTLALGTLAWRFVETPAMRLRLRHLAAARAPL
jgi:peptidoglycan/LPS O-acetylase OafA/YrhL